eukprot:TRINITY_DN93014_c0_g1_i1.p1 TRINITY_DN93014_c0_g1~~TRINITY_DN93014_c0_g1_i1.p1  ORF type:complete len:102 (+),score=20.70 TRINITY_DN93014_c0_g1_i1:27-332(+)
MCAVFLLSPSLHTKDIADSLGVESACKEVHRKSALLTPHAVESMIVSKHAINVGKTWSSSISSWTAIPYLEKSTWRLFLFLLFSSKRDITYQKIKEGNLYL